jgi:hypothetical protein
MIVFEVLVIVIVCPLERVPVKVDKMLGMTVGAEVGALPVGLDDNPPVVVEVTLVRVMDWLPDVKLVMVVRDCLGRGSEGNVGNVFGLLLLSKLRGLDSLVDPAAGFAGDGSMRETVMIGPGTVT